MTIRSTLRILIATFGLLIVSSITMWAQIDKPRADSYFREAKELCEREGGRLWGVSLCGPMVFADPTTGELATNQPAPPANRPNGLGFVNAPLDWGGTSWSAYVWSMIPADNRQERGRLMIHELFHRVQPQLGLMVLGKSNDHLDTLEGRYWMQLEWRALSRALRSSAAESLDAIRDALAFRAMRRGLFPEGEESERILEVREGLAQHAGTVAAASSREEAVSDAIRQLAEYEKAPTYVRTFAYPSGAGYGVLLDGLFLPAGLVDSNQVMTLVVSSCKRPRSNPLRTPGMRRADMVASN